MPSTWFAVSTKLMTFVGSKSVATRLRALFPPCFFVSLFVCLFCFVLFCFVLFWFWFFLGGVFLFFVLCVCVCCLVLFCVVCLFVIYLFGFFFLSFITINSFYAVMLRRREHHNYLDIYSFSPFDLWAHTIQSSEGECVP